MLANPDFKWKKQPEIQVWRKHSKDGETSIELDSYGPVESTTLFREALRHNEVQLFSLVWLGNSGKFSKFLCLSMCVTILACLFVSCIHDALLLLASGVVLNYIYEKNLHQIYG
jgi:hypothetical protein